MSLSLLLEHHVAILRVARRYILAARSATDAEAKRVWHELGDPASGQGTQATAEVPLYMRARLWSWLTEAAARARAGAGAIASDATERVRGLSDAQGDDRAQLP